MFCLKKMEDHCTIAMIAKRASGKSYLTREILFHKRELPSIIIGQALEKCIEKYKKRYQQEE